jgi:hypothetical protein
MTARYARLGRASGSGTITNRVKDVNTIAPHSAGFA